ncbi:hypothetical protein F2Q70_00030638 [Brassica cretica]|uniref:Protein kinase domain-containing protein n=1 Tax=Brassica cretica TaxID=69181 RepID=A0A8S9FJ19_BRACR|nr:hypothetical protein F2Q70_00030638 [Brassica cretica]
MAATKMVFHHMVLIFHSFKDLEDFWARRLLDDFQEVFQTTSRKSSDGTWLFLLPLLILLLDQSPAEEGKQAAASGYYGGFFEAQGTWNARKDERRSRTNREESRNKGGEPRDESNESGLIYNLHLLSLMHVFTFKQLHSATGGFSKSNVVGHGGFGLVYRGLLNNGRKVAIKFIDNAGNQGEEEFKMEVELLSRLRSPYLLSLLGYCSDNSHKLLVYEYMPNGCLQQHLYPINNDADYKFMTHGGQTSGEVGQRTVESSPTPRRFSVSYPWPLRRHDTN